LFLRPSKSSHLIAIAMMAALVSIVPPETMKRVANRVVAAVAGGVVAHDPKSQE
jgi:hypothetical protein